MKSLTVLLLGLMVASTGWSDRLKKKIDKVTKSTYQLDNYSLRSVSINQQIEAATPSVLSKNLHEVVHQDSSYGYIYVAQAPSMKDVFDYIVLMDADFKIVNTKVLIYREKHGRQIGTKRWLSQFLGLTTSDRPTLGVQIDGISGATISVEGMIEAVNNLMVSLDTLKSDRR